MTGSRSCLLTVLALVLALTIIPTGWSESQKPTQSGWLSSGSQEKHSSKSALTCTIYALGDLGDDAGLGQWVAETIPEVIEPGSWTPGEVAAKGEGKPRLRYYPPGKILVVYHTAAVQTQVDAFLKDVKKSLATGKTGTTARSGKTAAKEPVVVPARYSAPGLIRTADPAAAESSYPVPAPRQQPKHLFHFIIRYEGEGIVDNNVAELIKYLEKQNSADADKAKSAPEDAKPTPATAEKVAQPPLQSK